MLAFYKREYSALPLQSARIAQSRESNLDSCRPMSLSSYRLESRRDLQTANKVCGLYPFSPERETCCILPVNQLSRAYFLTKWKKCNIVSLFLQIHIVESTIHHSLMRTVHPFFQERSCILHFPFWRNFSILSFYKKYSASLLRSLGIAPSRGSVQNACQVFLKSRELNSRSCLFCLLFPRYNNGKLTE